MIYRNTLLLLCFCLPVCAFAQRVSGIVRNERMEAMPAAYVHWVGNAQGVNTDESGRFAISSDGIADKRLVAWHADYLPDTLNMGDSLYASFVLRLLTTLDDVVIQAQRHLGHRNYRPIWLMMQKMKVMMADLVDWYAMLDHLTAGVANFPAVPEKSGSEAETTKTAANLGLKAQSEEGKGLELMPVEIKGLNLQLPHSHPWFIHAQGGRLRLISMLPESLKELPYNHHHPVPRKTTPLTPEELPAGMNIRMRSKDKRPRPWFEDDPYMGRLRYTEIMIVNARRNLDGIHHYVSSRYLRNYLGEFCYLTNRRYSGEQKVEHMFGLFVSKAWNLPYLVDASD